MITIRDVTLKDARALLDIYAYYTTSTAISFEYTPPSLSDFENRISAITERFPYLAAIDESGDIVGYAYAGPFIRRAAYDRCAELTVYVHKDHRRDGIGGLLYRRLEELLSAMGYLNLYACIGHTDAPDEYLTNNSEEFHRHLGFETVGVFRRSGYKFGRWYDMIWMEKIIGGYDTPPADVITYHELKKQ